ncbi:hypothetical protein [Vreelandella piezotolerans]|uniref:hypothetical protein n=1 Tax=Vreelandella piezotolerans TaxID=2609667 RepID=UPI001C6261F4|nr:hypothetical protein [Halomonas piezotolerans]
MNEIDILKKLASNLTERKSVAALSNYEVLCNNISFSHDLLEKGISYLKHIVSALKCTLNKNDSLRLEYQNGNDLNSFIALVPSLLSNDLEAINKLSLHTKPDNRDDIDVNNVGRLHRGFVEYNNLVTAKRQLVDSLVTDAYQIQLLDPKEFNYHALLSLNSFERYATKSIRQGLFNDDIEDALTEFRNLSFRDWRNSAITRCQHVSFANKVDYLFSELSLNTPESDDFRDEIKNLFKFSSEFTHIGYISTFFTSQSGSQPVFGSDKGPYLPSTENFSELKYQIIESCINFILKVYVPSIKLCVNKMVLDDFSEPIIGSLDNLISMLEHGIQTRNNNYYFFVCSSLIGSKNTIELPCICGHINHWNPPHDNADLFCMGCGSSYNIMAMDGDPGYIITSNGPVKVIGSTAPDFQDLSFEEQQELMQKVAECNAGANSN